MRSDDHKIQHAVLAIINDGDGSMCGLNYKRRCELADYGLLDYCHAAKKFDPSLTRRQSRTAGKLIQEYYRNHVAEIHRIERNNTLNESSKHKGCQCAECGKIIKSEDDGISSYSGSIHTWCQTDSNS